MVSSRTAAQVFAGFLIVTSMFIPQDVPEWSAEQMIKLRNFVNALMESASPSKETTEQPPDPEPTQSHTTETKKNEEMFADPHFKTAFDFQAERESMKTIASKTAAANGKKMIKSVNFSRYDEANDCTVKHGIATLDFNKTVDHIAKLHKMPVELSDMMKAAQDLDVGQAQVINRISLKTREGNMVFGKFVVVKRGDRIDLAYSINGVDYEVSSVQPDSKAKENADKAEKFRKNYMVDIDFKDDFEAYFHQMAVTKFGAHCRRMMLNVFQNDTSVLKAFDIGKESEDLPKREAPDDPKQSKENTHSSVQNAPPSDDILNPDDFY